VSPFWKVVAFVAGFVGFWLGRAIFKAINEANIRSEAKRWMTEGKVERARILLSLYGHRMDKHTREALTVWLAERGEGLWPTMDRAEERI